MGAAGADRCALRCARLQVNCGVGCRTGTVPTPHPGGSTTAGLGALPCCLCALLPAPVRTLQSAPAAHTPQAAVAVPDLLSTPMPVLVRVVVLVL